MEKAGTSASSSCTAGDGPWLVVTGGEGPRTRPPFRYSRIVACDSGYDTACSLGMCAERNAISSMITAGESRIERIAIAMPDGRAEMPCRACQEMMMQLSPDSGSIRILADSVSEAEIRLSELAGPWWGHALIRQE